MDRSFPNRQPQYFENLLKTFGEDSVRLARFHAKFILLKNDKFDVAVRTSMNLNLNKRIENYEISEGSKISTYIRDVVDTHFDIPLGDNNSTFKNLKIEQPEKTFDFENFEVSF